MSAPSYDKKTVLVTGGAGFIGSHLCEALVKRAQVICVDNFSTGTPAHLQNLLQNPNFELLRHDINEPIDLESQRELDRFHVRVHGIQEIYHLACPVTEQSFEQ
nr:GDP-mannose 4,6-dehydratase [Patescibacteria group bacterium]